MCIIMYCPAKKSIKEEKIRTAFENNPDGAGIMWYDTNGGVHYRKGFTDADKLVNFFKGLGTETPRAIHCRIATSGKISTKTCHPFPIVEKIEDMGNEKGDPEWGAMMHNGVFTSYTPKEGMKAEYSDTMNYNRYVIFPLVSNGAIYNQGVINLLSDMTSRVLLFLPDFMVGRFGSWVEDAEDGFYASNDTYKYIKYVYRYSKPTYPYTTNAPDYGYEYTEDGWWKLKSRKPTCETTSVIKKPQYTYSIMVNAKSYMDAYDLMDEFLAQYHGLIDDEDYVVETLEALDKGIYEFSFDSYENIEQYQKVKEPFFVSYWQKIVDVKN